MDRNWRDGHGRPSIFRRKTRVLRSKTTKEIARKAISGQELGSVGQDSRLRNPVIALDDWISQPAVRRLSDGVLVRLQPRRLNRYVYPYQKSYRVGRPTIATNRQFNKPHNRLSADRRNPPPRDANARHFWSDKQQMSQKEQIQRLPGRDVLRAGYT